MPPFPERESSILAILKKKKPGRVPEGAATTDNGTATGVIKERKSPALSSLANHSAHNASNQSADLLGLSSPPATGPSAGTQQGSSLVDVLDVFTATTSSSPPVNNGFGSSFQPVDNLKKYVSSWLILKPRQFASSGLSTGCGLRRQLAFLADDQGHRSGLQKGAAGQANRSVAKVNRIVECDNPDRTLAGGLRGRGGLKDADEPSRLNCPSMAWFQLNNLSVNAIQLAKGAWGPVYLCNDSNNLSNMLPDYAAN